MRRFLVMLTILSVLSLSIAGIALAANPHHPLEQRGCARQRQCSA